MPLMWGKWVLREGVERVMALRAPSKQILGGIQNAEGGLYFKLNINMSICESQKIILEWLK